MYFAVAFSNVIIVAIFGLLAYHFNHWWIILFATFCTMTLKHSTKEDKNKDDNKLELIDE